MSRYYYWSHIELITFFTTIYAILIHLLFRQLSPFKAYMYYLMKASHGSDCKTLWREYKLFE